MKARFFLSLVGVFLLVGCAGNGDNATSQSESTQPPTTGTKAPEFGQPLVNQTKKPGSAAVPGLLQPTNSKTRASVVVMGRRDPFAALPTPPMPMLVTSNRSTAPVKIAPLPANAANRPMPTLPLPAIATAPLPNLSNSPMPGVGIPVPVAPPPSPTALAESIEVSGVVQVGGKWSVIVKEPSAGSSRHVAVGEYLENGKVLVKKIVSPQGIDPVVVLQQGGVEIRKSLV